MVTPLLAATLTGWPLAAVSIGGGIIVGLLFGALGSGTLVSDLELRNRLLRDALARIGRGAPDPSTIALHALHQDELVRTRADREDRADAME